MQVQARDMYQENTTHYEHFKAKELYADHLNSLMYHSPHKRPDLKICFGLHTPNGLNTFRTIVFTDSVLIL